ncbi:MAG: ParB/RepB/Spo0J family partition protein [Chloroflexi bacterium]|uniref:ParB/RepB/Spo0J family partition protein n=1 Tax=Candidatus Chlorohelix allophototropha TaxID=3003348 RepID=A0A8T7LZG3_9CHLR|nr:ParB/RepB/Spo0J family partition protein [Chloroflexota bacterium]WJW65785.1 ParB/RepB/Spo0J family partition protein [Chloroflexota bacterium L227-S17]
MDVTLSENRLKDIAQLQIDFELPNPPTYDKAILSIGSIALPKEDEIDAGHVKAILASFKLLGQLDPIIVNDRGTEFDLIDGRHRVAAAIAAGWETIDALVVVLDGKQSDLVLLTRNLVRQNNWFMEVAAMSRLLKQYEKHELAAALSKMPNELNGVTKLALLPEPLVEQISNGKVSKSAASKLPRLKPAALKRLAELAAGGTEITAELVADALQRGIQAGVQAVVRELDVPDLEALEPAQEVVEEIDLSCLDHLKEASKHKPNYPIIAKLIEALKVQFS